MNVGWLPVLESDTYRRLDRCTKLLGVVLVAAGLEVGGGTVMGFVLGTAGAVVALSTLIVTVEDETADESNG